MSDKKTDFLRFSAYSIKDLITRKLSEDSKFTDQVYEGSNLAILIDLVSYMYQCLIYQLNNAASESMFSDTQIYENISRLINLIGYHPKGIIPAQATFYLENDSEDSKQGIFIPKYSYVNTGLTDKNGNEIYYSLTENNGFKITNDEVQEFILTNGKWKLYSTVFTASGSEYEQFETTIGSDVENQKFCANNMIDVYVHNPNTDIEEQKWVQWTRTDTDIFTNVTNNPNEFSIIFDNESKIYTVKLDENKNYIIKFGNGTIGSKLPKDAQIYVFYLDTNGIDGAIDIDKISNSLKLECKASDFSLSNELYKRMVLNNQENITTVDDETVEIFLSEQSSTPKQEETVEQIKEHAPNWFKIGQRLVTASDYEYYMKNIATTSVVDCKVQNNWEYCSTFYKWLYDLGLNGYNVQNGLRQSEGNYYINESNFVKYDYKFADPSDANNVYIWTKMETGTLDSLKNTVSDNIQRLKTLTQEVVFLNPIIVKFALTAAPIEKVMEYITSDSEFDAYGDSYLEITLNNNTLYSASTVQNKIENIFIDFFSSRNNRLGGNIEYQNLLNKIYEINGIERVRTIYQPEDNKSGILIRDGLCFASWSGTYVDVGDDLEVSNTTRTLLDFQFPELQTRDISSRIKVIRKSINNMNQIKY